MSDIGINSVNVYYFHGVDKLLMGRLTLKGRKIFFEYDPEFIKTGIELSPFKLPLKSGIFSPDDLIFEGLFGVFNDSLPDGWGRLLLDRKLTKSGVNPNGISPLERLCYVGINGMGALGYEPVLDGTSTPYYDSLEKLDEIAEHILQFQEHDEDSFVDELLTLNGSSAGARPKYLVRLVSNEDWIIKFKSFNDPKDIGPIEYAYHQVALEAKLDVPPAKLFKSQNGPGYFGVKRFDHIGNTRLHMHSISGLLHTSHRLPNLDYETIMKTTWWLTKDIRECEKLFRLATFNVFMHNRDDHAKNFSYLLDIDGKWHLSPAYDLTFSSGPLGEHCTTIMGEGRNPSTAHLLKLAEVSNINKQRAIQIIEEVMTATNKWEYFASIAGVSKNTTLIIKKAINF
jgi:serine/threonine-protein kinase HipA